MSASLASLCFTLTGLALVSFATRKSMLAADQNWHGSANVWVFLFLMSVVAANMAVAAWLASFVIPSIESAS